MTKTLILLTCIPLLAAAGWPARPHLPPVAVDGCEILASVVYMEVTGARFGYPGRPGDDVPDARRDGMFLCNRTTDAATRAFTAALQHADIFVTWGYHVGYSGDYCLSHVLSECYPTGDRAMPPLSREDRLFVMRSWQAVYGAIANQMLLYPGSNVSRFQGRELGRTIRHSIVAGRNTLVPDSAAMREGPHRRGIEKR